MKRTLSVLGLVLVSAPAFAQLLPCVSDAEANGRDIVHLGALDTGSMFMESDCIEELALGAKCTVLAPQPLSSFRSR